ncbi:polymer-forming cytoskeletal protein [Paenibacillus sp. NFR01]|uniref:polymer-forming cytoskeletal protein n=1 Tax=Paenibacillus sp. NFR01 TaxID=1566279 RepID=UPI0008C962EC|nr:polymer-forming cytoskeletal protein [Paenibacillus sp. NFR01]SET45484.1 Polymer-forming protein [Paenibacillus sp. NFR01]
MKFYKVMLVAGMSAALLSGCGSNNNNDAANNAAIATATAAATAEAPDAVTTASIVNQADAFTSAVSDKGNWIVAILNDLTLDKDVVVAGEFHDKGKAENDIYRKLALYAQDADRNITATYTLTVPNMTVQSENFRIQGGTVKGDVTVEANGFNLYKDAKIDGNLHFANADVQATAKIEGTVTGTTDVK